MNRPSSTSPTDPVRSLWTVLATSALLLGCNSTGVGNPGTISQGLQVQGDLELEPEAGDAAEQLAAGALEHAILVFGQLRFLACDDSEDDVTLKGPIAVDLLTNRVLPESLEVPIPEAGFCGIDAPLTPAQRPAAMAGRSLFFSGTRSDGALFMLFANMEGTLHMRPRPGVEWPTDGAHAWLWVLRPRRWVLPSELQDAEPETLDDVDRVIAIDANRHSVLYELIRSRLAGRSTLHLDLDDDHRLDSEERSGDALLGQGLDQLE